MSSAAEPAPSASSSSVTPESDQVTSGTRAAYGASAFAENLALNSVNQLANPIFNLTLGVSPVLVGTALALPRVWDAVMDPWIGSISGNRTRRGAGTIERLHSLNWSDTARPSPLRTLKTGWSADGAVLPASIR